MRYTQVESEFLISAHEGEIRELMAEKEDFKVQKAKIHHEIESDYANTAKEIDEDIEAQEEIIRYVKENTVSAADEATYQVLLEHWSKQPEKNKERFYEEFFNLNTL